MTGHEMITCWLFVQMLTEEEASSVTINNPNPDFGGPAYAIDVSGEWTGYEDRRFEGDSLLKCLDEANQQRVHAQGKAHP